jgi:uncharacterized protein YeaO (DUF488 family)
MPEPPRGVMCPDVMSDDRRCVVKRVDDPPETADGYGVLLDHVWPRRVSYERANWMSGRTLAPGDEVRCRFDHIPERYDEFAPTIATRSAASDSRTMHMSWRPSRCHDQISPTCEALRVLSRVVNFPSDGAWPAL